ncbi:MAG: hypothetical protein LBH97_07445, partial [Treponema sp.]|nr:hypothetical protein [Treponema sp.]
LLRSFNTSNVTTMATMATPAAIISFLGKVRFGGV